MSKEKLAQEVAYLRHKNACLERRIKAMYERATKIAMCELYQTTAVEDWGCVSKHPDSHLACKAALTIMAAGDEQ